MLSGYANRVATEIFGWISYSNVENISVVRILSANNSVMSGLVYAVALKVPPPLAGGGQGEGGFAIFDTVGSFTHPSIPSRQGRGG